jgi:hypothetical protein
VDDDQDNKQRREEESIKLYFEIYKHVATLDVATAVVLITVYREAAVQLTTLVIALLAFCFSLVASFFGMFRVVNMMRRPEVLQSWARDRLLNVVFAGSAPLYLAGLLAFALAAITGQ